VNEKIETDVDALSEEVKKLRADFMKLADVLKTTAGHAGEEAANQARAAGERAWSGAKTQADDRPLHSTAIAFGAGLVLGLLFAGRR
jgi:ElaB/YqjD/DUF883 family membrane-anchored ribosome-binding protein